MRVLLIAALAIGLPGCWTGLNLYHPSDARPAIPAGVYIAGEPKGPQRAYRVSILPHGMTKFDGQEDKDQVYGFAPLGTSGMLVAWWDIEGRPDGRLTENDANQMYALMVRGRDSSFRIYAPACTDEGAKIARKYGAAVEGGASPTCRFADRASLEAALRRLPRKDADALDLMPVGPRG